MILLTDVISQSSNFCVIVLDETTYYITAFAVDSNGTMIDVQTNSITTSFGYIPTSNTLFYIKNDGEISDYSSYNHTMQWSGTAQYTTLSNGRKVAKFDGSNLIHSTNFNEANNKTTFTMHGRVRNLQVLSTESSPFGRMGRSQSSMSTTDRRGAKRQTEPSATTNWYIIYGGGTSEWRKNVNVGYIPSSSSFDLMTFTFNGKNVKVYRNGTLVGSRTGTDTIRGGSTTGTTLFAGGGYSYNGVANSFQPCEIGEIVLEDKTETDAEVLDFYNKTKNHYV